MKYLFFLLLPLLLFACKQEVAQAPPTKEAAPLTYPDWAKNANIYEVNTRQYTEAGTFNAFAEHLPRLQKMGVDILWFMPVHPIGKVKRKGGMGSYYSVADYKGLNPDLGTKEDFQRMIDKIHELDMKIIIDWVPNHSSWDNPWIAEHPDWYDHIADTISHPHDLDGKPTDWYDVADLNYDNQDMRKEMIASMDFWVKEFNIDGFRCDVAGFVPYDFWEDARKELHKTKQLFMLAEWEDPRHTANKAFDMYYSWELHHLMNQVASGKEPLSVIPEYFKRSDERFAPHAIRMNFTSNHDENSWNGTEFDRMGDNAIPMAVFSVAIPGMPLIYSGQESKLDKKLAFFEKDQIEWGDFPLQDFYTTLLDLKHKNQALWNEQHGGPLVAITDQLEDGIYGFSREKDGNKIVAFFNFSDKPQEVKSSIPLEGLQHVLGEKAEKQNFTLAANSYVLLGTVQK